MNEISKFITKFILKNMNNTNIEPLNTSHLYIKRIQHDIFIANKEWNKYIMLYLRNSQKRGVGKDQNAVVGKGKIQSTPNTFLLTLNSEEKPIVPKKGDRYNLISQKMRSIIESQPFFNKSFEINFSEQHSGNQSQIKVHLHYFLSPNDPSIKELDPEKINIYFQKCMQKIFIWFYIANKYKLKVCSKNLNVYLYLTNTPKLFPDDTNESIDIDYVNTGFTFACLPNNTPNEIYVYREEEWFKVLIHETIHSFGMEFSTNESIENYANKRIIEMFQLPPNSTENEYGSGYNIFESYTEMTAEIVNILIYNFLYGGKLSKLFEVEQKFSCFQSAKFILRNFPEQSSRKLKFPTYKEKTNIFSYFILKSMLMFNINNYMDWAIRYNGSLNFNKTIENIKSYSDLIQQTASSISYSETIYKMKLWLSKEKEKYPLERKTIRMTVLEY